MRLEGKVALVTGGARGIGRGTIEMLAREGAAVGFTARSEDTGLDVERAVRDAGGAVCHEPVPELDFEALQDSAPAGSS